MATKFLEPGGDADFGTFRFWSVESGAPVLATDFVHGSHLKSLQYRAANSDTLGARAIASDAGGRFSFWIYLVALPTANARIMGLCQANFGSDIFKIQLTSGGVLQLVNDANTQLGSNGSTLATGTWYRICFAFKITSTTVNELRVFKNGTLDITASNSTTGQVTSSELYIGNVTTDATLNFRSSDHYIDDSNGLTDTGNIWVTAKRPNANGTTNGFTTQIGSGGSGYGTGHSPQVNERPLSTTNGWSMVGAGSAITEEYNIEGKSTGDINISTATIVDYMGWVSAKAVLSETGSIIVNNVSSNIALTSTTTLFTKAAGSSTYPAGTGTDIGIITSTTVTTVSLYEAGVIVAYIPAVAATNSNFLMFM